MVPKSLQGLLTAHLTLTATNICTLVSMNSCLQSLTSSEKDSSGEESLPGHSLRQILNESCESSKVSSDTVPLYGTGHPCMKLN